MKKLVPDILIVGGTHGDERSGVAVVLKLRQKKVAGVETIIANPVAVKKRRRFIESDLNRSFRVKYPKTLEQKRARRLAVRLKKYNAIIDFHNTVSRTTCGILTTRRPRPRQLKICAAFGLRRVVIMPPGHSLIGVCPQKAISLEIAKGNKNFSVDYLVKKIKELRQSLGSVEIGRLEFYYCDGLKITKTELRNAKLNFKDFLDFKPFSQKTLKCLGLEGPGIQVPFLVGETAYGADFAFNVARRVILKI